MGQLQDEEGHPPALSRIKTRYITAWWGFLRVKMAYNENINGLANVNINSLDTVN